jgi:glycosyltransferase involved in cell wall biosynthesis
MKLVFYCDPRGYRTYPFDGSSLEAGVGGSESALINLGRALARRGHEVVAYTSTTRPIEVDGVAYRPSVSFDDPSCDVLVVFRFYAEAIRGARRRLTVLWSLDLPVADPPYEVDRSLAEVDAVVAISEFHASRIVAFGSAAGIPKLAEKIWIGGCGVWASDYREALPKIPQRFIYCSVPDRGLVPLLGMWPALRRELPEATLAIFGGYALWGLVDREPALRELADAPGVQFRGVVPRRELVREQLLAELHLHPCSLEENFCLASMECQAAGTPSIVSSRGALPTTVIDNRSGRVVPGDPDRDGFAERFVEAAVALAKDRRRRERMAAFARLRARQEFDYMRIAERWEHELRARLTGR